MSNITITMDQIIVWVVIGILAGSLAGMLVKRSKKRFGALSNLLIGLVGALIGGFLFDLFKINLNLGKITISFDDLLAALAGSLIFLVILALVRKN